MTGWLEEHCQHCSVVSSDSTSVEVALDSYDAVSVVNFKPDQTRHLVSVLLFVSCHLILILFVSSTNSIQIVRRQCCLSLMFTSETISRSFKQEKSLTPLFFVILFHNIKNLETVVVQPFFKSNFGYVSIKLRVSNKLNNYIHRNIISMHQ